MAGFKTKVRKVGTSLGVLIPIEEIKKENIKVDDIVKIKLTKKENLDDSFGVLKDSKIDAQKAKDKSRRIWSM